MKKNCLFKYSCLLLLCFGIYSCDGTDSSEDSVQENLSPTIVEAMNYLKTTELSLPDMHQTLRVNTRSVMEGTKPKSRTVVPDWSSLQTYCDEYEDVLLFQLKENAEPLSGFVYTRVKGKVERLLAVSTSKLALWKVQGKLVGRVITYLPDRKFLKDGHKVTELGYKLQGSTYTGLCLVSTLDGTFLYGDKYNRGHHVFHFVSNQQKIGNIKTRSAVLPEIDSVHTDHIYIALFSESDAVQPQLAYSAVEEDDFTCSFCGRPASQCTCVIITPGGGTAYCPLCGAPIGYCNCFSGGSTGGNTGGNQGGDSVSGESGGGSSIGGGGSSSSGDSGTQSEIKSAINISYAAKDFPGYGANGMDCYKLSDYILNKMLSDYVKPGVSYFIRKADENGSVRYTGTAKEAFNIINQHLDTDRPIKAGVDYKKGGNQSDNLTDHWIVINGRGYDMVKQQYYFTYIETGRYKESAAAAVGDNRLYYDEARMTISGKKWNGKQTYNLVQIKKNKK